MGGREVGGMCNLLPGYRHVQNPQDRDVVEQFWKLKPGQISSSGVAPPGISSLAGEWKVGCLWIVATNPSACPTWSVPAASRRSPFTVYQDAYYPTETAAYAHVLPPALPSGENWDDDQLRAGGDALSCVRLPPGERRQTGRYSPK